MPESQEPQGPPKSPALLIAIGKAKEKAEAQSAEKRKALAGDLHKAIKGDDPDTLLSTLENVLKALR